MAISFLNNGVFAGDVNINGLLDVNTGASNTVAIFESTSDKAIIRIKDDDTDTYLISRNNAFSIGDSSADYNNFKVNITNGNTEIAGSLKATQLELESAVPSVLFDETDVTANWRNRVQSGSYRVQYASDGSTFSDYFVLGASANTVEKDTTFTEQAFSAATSSGDPSSTLTTKGYVDANADTGVPAILSNGTVPSLNTGITATEINTLLGTMTGFGVSNLPSGTGTTFTISQGQTLGIVGGTDIQAVVNTTNETITLNYTGSSGSGTVTGITEGPGITVTASATSPTVAVDYIGADSLVMEAATGTPDADDFMIYGADSSDGGDTKKIQFIDVPLSIFDNDAGFGTVTSVGSGAGLTGGPFTVSGSIAVDYVGTDSIIKAAPTLSGAVALSDFLLIASSNGNVYETTFSNLPFATNVAPAAPSSLVATIVGETIEIQFAASTTSNIGYYQVWSSDDGGDYGIIGQISPTDFSSTMTVVDTTFLTGGTMSYRVYAVKNGIYSSAATVSKSYTVSALSVTAMTVVNLNTAYYIQYEKPVSRFIDHIEIYMDSQTTLAALNRSNASIVYSGQNASYMRNVNASNNFHQFWVEVVTS